MCRCAELEAQTSQVAKELEDVKESLKNMESAYEEAVKEVGEVKQRARALLEEKDLQLQAARVQTPL